MAVLFNFACLAACFGAGQEGIASMEYSLLGVLIAVVIVGAVGTLGTKVFALYDTIANAFL